MPQLFLNERSCETAADPDRVNSAMSSMVEAVLAIAREDQHGTALVTQAHSLMALQLAPGHPISKWMGARDTEDLRVRLKRLDDKSPYETVFPDGETFSDVEYRHDGEAVRGLGFAHLLGGVGISLPLEARWDADQLTLVQERLADEDGGTALTDVQVPHAARQEHVATHLPWIREQTEAVLLGGLEAVRTGAELWARCAEAFPYLRFLPGAEAQLRELKQQWVHPVCKRLVQMDRAVRLWVTTREPDGPQWGSMVTPEHQTRKREYCVFTDLDGTSQYFDTHVRFTPDEGRLHFRFVQAAGRVHIAHVGGKLDP